MELDTGATLSVMSERETLWPTDGRPPSTYAGERISVLEQITLRVSFQQQNHSLSLLVVPALPS